MASAIPQPVLLTTRVQAPQTPPWGEPSARTSSRGQKSYIWPEDLGIVIPSSQGVRDLLLEYINAGVLPLPSAFEISFSHEDYASSRVFKVAFARPPGPNLPCSMFLRIIAPIDPHRRTESQVAWLWHLRQYTNIPSPHVYYFDSSAGNPQGVKWMLTSANEDPSLEDVWYNDGVRAVQWPANRLQKKMLPEELEDVFRQLTGFKDTLESLRFREVGNLQCDWVTGQFFIDPMPVLSSSGDETVETLGEDAPDEPEPWQVFTLQKLEMVHGKLIHVKFDPRAILIDVRTNRVTGILDLAPATIVPAYSHPRGPVVTTNL